MLEGLRRLYSGEFNVMSQKHQPDGSIIITISSDGANQAYQFKVKDLYGPNEVVTDHKVIPLNPPQWVIDRMTEAHKHGGTDKPIT